MSLRLFRAPAPSSGEEDPAMTFFGLLAAMRGRNQAAKKTARLGALLWDHRNAAGHAEPWLRPPAAGVRQTYWRRLVYTASQL